MSNRELTGLVRSLLLGWSQSMGERRFTLRLSMAVIAVLGCTLAWVRSQGSFGYALVVVAHSAAIARAFCPVFRGHRALGRALGDEAAPCIFGGRRRLRAE